MARKTFQIWNHYSRSDTDNLWWYHIWINCTLRNWILNLKWQDPSIGCECLLLLKYGRRKLHQYSCQDKKKRQRCNGILKIFFCLKVFLLYLSLLSSSWSLPTAVVDDCAPEGSRNEKWQLPWGKIKITWLIVLSFRHQAAVLWWAIGLPWWVLICYLGLIYLSTASGLGIKTWRHICQNTSAVGHSTDNVKKKVLLKYQPRLYVTVDIHKILPKIEANWIYRVITLPPWGLSAELSLYLLFCAFKKLVTRHHSW